MHLSDGNTGTGWGGGNVGTGWSGGNGGTGWSGSNGGPWTVEISKQWQQTWTFGSGQPFLVGHNKAVNADNVNNRNQPTSMNSSTADTGVSCPISQVWGDLSVEPAEADQGLWACLQRLSPAGDLGTPASAQSKSGDLFTDYYVYANTVEVNDRSTTTSGRSRTTGDQSDRRAALATQPSYRCTHEGPGSKEDILMEMWGNLNEGME